MGRCMCIVNTAKEHGRSRKALQRDCGHQQAK